MLMVRDLCNNQRLIYEQYYANLRLKCGFLIIVLGLIRILLIYLPLQRKLPYLLHRSYQKCDFI